MYRRPVSLISSPALLSYCKINGIQRSYFVPAKYLGLNSAFPIWSRLLHPIMNLKSLCTLSLFLIAVQNFSASAQSRVKKAVFVIVDGISSDALESVARPNLDAISKVGGIPTPM
jgi:predicted AlkP superfamily pyrophosphatase or phosphodiesterase